MSRSRDNSSQSVKKNRFNNYKNRNWDFDYLKELEYIHIEQDIALDQAETEAEREAVTQKYKNMYDELEQRHENGGC